MTAYYNEFDPDAAAWLRELIEDNLIAPGDVDERSIIDVQADDIKGYDQHHWFAGIGCWSYALRLADWPDDKSVWTASLPCQPFSIAGKQLGKQDERHLLPHFLSLVAQCRPSILFGEQVSAAIKHGWLDDLYAEMEAHNYSVGSVVIGAHSIGAAHIRQRLYWVANNGGLGNTEHNGYTTGAVRQETGASKEESGVQQPERSSTTRWLYCRDNKYRPIESGLKPLVDVPACGMVHSRDPRNTQEARKMRLKGYGNAIVPTLAAEFIRAANNT